jgi:hypothetical protein
MENFEEFFQETGVDKETFEGAKTKALNFGQKFKSTFAPEFNSQVTEAQQRAKRLDNKPYLITGVPNSFLYFFLLVSGIYVAQRLIYNK